MVGTGAELLTRRLDDVLAGRASLEDWPSTRAELASELRDLVEIARAIPPMAPVVPDPAFRRRARAALVEAIEADDAAAAGRGRLRRVATAVGLAGPPRTRLASARAAALVAALLLVLGAGGAVDASQGALPGDALYPVKLQAEQLRLALALDEEAKARVHLELASRRAGEIEQARAAGRQAAAASASDAFVGHIGSAELLLTRARDAGQDVGALDDLLQASLAGAPSLPARGPSPSSSAPVAVLPEANVVAPTRPVTDEPPSPPTVAPRPALEPAAEVVTATAPPASPTDAATATAIPTPTDAAPRSGRPSDRPTAAPAPVAPAPTARPDPSGPGDGGGRPDPQNAGPPRPTEAAETPGEDRPPTPRSGPSGPAAPAAGRPAAPPAGPAGQSGNDKGGLKPVPTDEQGKGGKVPGGSDAAGKSGQAQGRADDAGNGGKASEPAAAASDGASPARSDVAKNEAPTAQPPAVGGAESTGLSARSGDGVAPPPNVGPVGGAGGTPSKSGKAADAGGTPSQSGSGPSRARS